MDPNETLRRIRENRAAMNELSARTDLADPSELARIDERNADLAYEIAELAGALDDWLSKGGFLPDDWARHYARYEEW